MMKCSNPIALGLAGVTLLFGFLLFALSVQAPNATADQSNPVQSHIGEDIMGYPIYPQPASYFVTEADLDMNGGRTDDPDPDDEKSSVTEEEEFFDYTWLFPVDPPNRR